MISIISAISAKNRGIGKNNKLLWDLPGDLRHFRAVTKGHPVIMGQRTWESLPEQFRPLPHRANIVLVHEGEYEAKGAVVVRTLEEAFTRAKAAPGGEEVFVVGGGQAYASALPFADRLYLTLIDDEKDADVFFPEYEKEFTNIISEEAHEEDEVKYRFVTLERV